VTSAAGSRVHKLTDGVGAKAQRCACCGRTRPWAHDVTAVFAGEMAASYDDSVTYSATQRLRSTVVLLVEDDQGTRDLYQSALRDDGLTVVALTDGLDALTYLETNTPSVLVLDLGLPRLHGRDVLAEMAATKLSTHVPVVIVTGEPADDLHTPAICIVLKKPVHAEELRDAVRECLARGRKLAEG